MRRGDVRSPHWTSILPGAHAPAAGRSVSREAPRSHTGQALDAGTRSFMEERFDHDFSGVQIHADERAARSAEGMGADAYTVGSHVTFGRGRFAPGHSEGRELLAHELAHVVQQSGSGRAAHGAPSGQGETLEAQADHAASAAVQGGPMPQMSPAAVGVQRRVSVRDVGRGEQSGFARVGELLDRLNAISQGLDFALTDGNLTYTLRPGGILSGFDRQMMGYIDSGTDIRMRMTNRHGLLGDHVGGFHTPVTVDAWQSGYVDIDDLLASSDLGLQTTLVHVLEERSRTANHTRRIGTPSMDPGDPAHWPEFLRAHRQGLQAEMEVLRGFFGDPTIRLVDSNRRRFRNARGDLIRERQRAGRGTAERGILAISWEVVLHDGGRVLTPEEYLEFLEAERTREQVARERLQGADEHRAGGRGVPAP
jgi:hypothetical protein